jgi:O-antigen/teichoic acid export membrane protein
MGLVRSVVKNTLAMGSVQLASQISTFILSVFLQYYIKDAYGYYSYAFALASLIFIIADFGLGFQMVVEVAPDKSLAPQYLTNTILLRSLLGVAGMLITAVIVLFSGLPWEADLAIMIIALATAFNWIGLVFTSMLTSFERMHYVLYTNLVERCFTVSLAIIALLLGYHLTAVVFIVLAGSILNVVLGYVVTSKYIVKPVRRANIPQSKRQLKTAVPYALTGVLQTSMYSLNAVLVMNLGLWLGADTLGAAHSTAVYNLSFNLIVALIAVPTVLITALLPVISRLYRTSTDLTRLTQQKVMKYMFALGLPLTVGGIILSDRIIQLIYSPTFWDSAAVFRVLLPVLAISYFGTGIGSVLASANHIRLNTLSSGIGAIVNAALCVVLIPLFGAMGAALAFTMAYVAMTFMAMRFLHRYVFKVNLVDIIVKPSIAALGMGGVLLLLPSLPLIPAVLVGGGVYLVLFFAVRVLNKEDKEILIKILKKEA